jgi:hypothetical protein
MLTIEKNIPIPFAQAGRPSKTVWWGMEVGDSVFVKGMKSSGGTYSYVKRKTGWKFAQRKEGDGIRVWRVA